jgi:NAD(P)H-hydrate epimerase
VASGGATRTGAARLAARAALRIGAGLVTLASPPEAIGVNAAQLTAIMIRGCDGAEGLARILQDPRFNALVLGPALGIHSETRDMVSVALQARRSLVLDADGLTSFEGMAGDLAQRFRAAPAVLTPHGGEFSRLFKGQDGIVEAPSKLEQARKAASFTGAVIVFKGPDTVIAAPDGRAAINENGTPDLATAGSGDVLAGMIAGLLAQGMPAFEAACAGVWMHAEAGAAFGPGLIAEDLPEEIPGVLRRLLAR